MTIEVKKVGTTITQENPAPHWEAVVDYGEFAGLVTIPLPARYLEGDDAETRARQCVEGLENLGEALLRFAAGMKNNGRPVGGKLVADGVRHFLFSMPGHCNTKFSSGRKAGSGGVQSGHESQLMIGPAAHSKMEELKWHLK